MSMFHTLHRRLANLHFYLGLLLSQKWHGCINQVDVKIAISTYECRDGDEYKPQKNYFPISD